MAAVMGENAIADKRFTRLGGRLRGETSAAMARAMKEFATLVVVRCPPERLFATMRDRMPELAASLNDIERIDELERREEPQGTVVVSRWQPRPILPAMLQARLGPDGVHWLDRAQWNETERTCRWSIEPSLGEGAITCAGETVFEPAMAGRGTRVRFAGNVSIDEAYLGSLVGAFRGPVRSMVETIATSMIPANFRTMAETAAKAATAPA
jgi:hypothetical protein